MSRVSIKTSIVAICVSLLFFLSSVGAPAVMGASVNASAAALAATPLSSLEANWSAADGNSANWNYNPQNRVNSSNAQYLGLSWLFPLPTHPTSLLSVAGGLGVDTSPLIINGTIYAVTQYGQVFALNAANGNVLWTDVLPLLPNSTAGLGAGNINLHLHQGEEAFTTKLFGNTPTFWISAPDHKAYAINALTGAYELNFSYFKGVKTVAGNNPVSVYASLASNIQIDEKRGIAVTSMLSSSSNNAARCFFRGYNILVNPPQLLWEDYCTPPQPGSGIPVDPNWSMNQVNNMTGAYIFYPGPSANGGGYIPPTSAINLKALPAAQLNATLYNDWGYVQSASCAATDGGNSPGAVGAGWGAPWLLDQKTGLTIVNTGNRGPYNGACNPGPDLWQAAVMALNDTNGKWIWGFQTSAHDEWDWDCSWYQAMGNETVGGVTTQVVWKTCKNGYLYELNAATGALIWAWTPPLSILQRCQYCYMLNPLNRTEMNYEFGNPTLKDTVIFPSNTAGFESDGAYSPVLNYMFLGSHNVPALSHYVPRNTTNYGQGTGQQGLPVPQYARATCGCDNATIEAVNAATGQMVWSHFIPGQGFRGGLATSGNVVFVTLSSGDLVMLNAKTGDLIRDYYIGGPLNNVPSIGATASGTMEVILPITAGIVAWGTGVPGDIVALTLQNIPPATTNIVTSTATVSAAPATTTSVSTVTAASTGFDATTVYGIAAVAVIFIIATGYLAMRGRKPGS
jgi:glucose dehydrogenase